MHIKWAKIEEWKISSITEYTEQLNWHPAVETWYNHFGKMSVSTKAEHMHILYIQ